MLTERFGQSLPTSRTGGRIKEHIMYAEREKGGLGRGEIIEAKTIGGADGRDQQELKQQPPVPVPVRLPARIAIEMTSSQARRRSPKARRLALIGAALLLAAGAGGTFGYHLWTVRR